MTFSVRRYPDTFIHDRVHAACTITLVFQRGIDRGAIAVRVTIRGVLGDDERANTYPVHEGVRRTVSRLDGRGDRSVSGRCSPAMR
ncbi:MAG: hypothetical protein ACHREM_11300 [Polyangiales bacterium]